MIITLILLNVCHWLGDYTHLSTTWMLNAKRLGKPLTPIVAHAGVHMVLFLICISFLHGLESGMIAAAIQLPTHFLIDVWKGRMNGWFPSLQNPANKYHWWVFGIDQWLHQMVIIGTVYFICF